MLKINYTPQIINTAKTSKPAMQAIKADTATFNGKKTETTYFAMTDDGLTQVSKEEAIEIKYKHPNILKAFSYIENKALKDAKKSGSAEVTELHIKKAWLETLLRSIKEEYVEKTQEVYRYQGSLLSYKHKGKPYGIGNVYKPVEVKDTVPNDDPVIKGFQKVLRMEIPEINKLNHITEGIFSIRLEKQIEQLTEEINQLPKREKRTLKNFWKKNEPVNNVQKDMKTMNSEFVEELKPIIENVTTRRKIKIKKNTDD